MRVEVGLAEPSLGEAAAVLADAFTGYPVPVTFTGESLRRMCALDDLVLTASVVARADDGRALGVALAALRAQEGRVAGMGVRRCAHREGLGVALGDAVLTALAAAGARRVILEALTVNAPALALYERRLGFTRRRRLVGFVAPASEVTIEPARWDEAMAVGGEPDSWQLRRAVSAARATSPLRAFPAVVPEHHAVARLLRDAGLEEAPVDQYELERIAPGRCELGGR